MMDAHAHVLIFPIPAQGHVNSMLKLAELLVLSGLHVTFLNSEFNHRLLLLHTDIQQRFSCYPNKFRFKTISDGLPDDHPRSGVRFMDLMDSMKTKSKPLLRELLIYSRSCETKWPPVTCVIADGIFSFALDVAKEIGLMCISFRTIGACCLWAYFSLPELIEAGKLPFKGDHGDIDNVNMDEIVTSIPGTESHLRRRDLPSFCRTNDLSNPKLQLVITETTQYSPKADAHILNTFEDLEGPILSLLRSHYPKLYTVGPLHAHLKSKLGLETTSSQSSNSLWEVDRSCMTWLDTQALKSVIYVSFGSVTILTRDQLIEFWHGLMNSKKPFLWVIRPDSIIGKEGESQIPEELIEGTKGRGYIVGWTPQEEVLAHPAVGGFWTHSGWNSTLESIVAGVPMICWPYFADQQVNSRFVSDVWKIGMDMKDTCDKVIVEKMVNKLMEARKDEFAASANHMAALARKCLSRGGSSYDNLNRLIEDIKLMSVERSPNTY